MCSASIRTAWPDGSEMALLGAAWSTRRLAWREVTWRRKASNASCTFARSYPSVELGRSSILGMGVRPGWALPGSCVDMFATPPLRVFLPRAHDSMPFLIGWIAGIPLERVQSGCARS